MSILDSLSTERQARFVALASDLAERIAPRATMYDRENSFAYADFEDLKAAGYLALTVPEANGGMGASLGEFVRAQGRLAQGNGATALASTMTLATLGREGYFRGWPAAIREKVFAAAVHDGATINSLATEPEAGSPSRGGKLATTARRVEGGWLINGRKTWSTLSPILTFMVVSAAIEGEDATGSFLVTRDTPGITVALTWDNLGMRATGSNDVLFADVFVPDADVFSAGKKADTKAIDAAAGSDSRAWGALPVSAVYLGVATAARDATVGFATERVPTSLGKPIATLPTIQTKIGEIDVMLLAARTLLWSVADEWDATQMTRTGFGGRVSAAKMTATNTAVQIVDLAMRVVGGASLGRDLPLERYYRDVRAGLHNPPMDDQTLVIVGRDALGQ